MRSNANPIDIASYASGRPGLAHAAQAATRHDRYRLVDFASESSALAA